MESKYIHLGVFDFIVTNQTGMMVRISLQSVTRTIIIVMRPLEYFRLYINRIEGSYAAAKGKMVCFLCAKDSGSLT